MYTQTATTHHHLDLVTTKLRLMTLKLDSGGATVHCLPDLLRYSSDKLWSFGHLSGHFPVNSGYHSVPT
ncbi:hypothetical protein TB1_044706 [Malus domestica]